MEDLGGVTCFYGERRVDQKWQLGESGKFHRDKTKILRVPFPPSARESEGGRGPNNIRVTTSVQLFVLCDSVYDGETKKRIC